MKIAVFGASGGTGAATIRLLLSQGHQVTAFVRSPSAALSTQEGLLIVQGDAMHQGDVARAVQGQDAVVVSLGNSQNPFALMFGAKRTTPVNICEIGTAHIISAMLEAGVKRLVVVSAFGIGATRAQLPLMFKLFYRLVLAEHMADKERQEIAVKGSGLDWTIIQPVGLTDKPGTGDYFVSTAGKIRKQQMPREDVALCIVRQLTNEAGFGQTISLSG